MKRLLIPALFAMTATAPACAGDTDPGHLKESRATAQEFMQKLGGVLKEQLATSGAESAIGVCKQVAPALAAEYSKDGRSVKRVSLKPRNQSQGTPDAWEAKVLHDFDQAAGKGQAAAELEQHLIVEESGGRWFRYMKAIPTQPLCLQCHGRPEQIPEGVQALLAREYPNDQATGYSAGLVRGAVSIRRKLD